jgi:alkylation response protein AidB-like acyl-CoA dehydrogenase
MKLEPQGSDAAICEEATAWLKSWLPGDYRDRAGDYRLDLDFRRAYQAAAFDAGWLMPSWGRELGGHEVGEEAEVWIKLNFARLSAPKLPNVQGPGVIAPALLEFGDESQRSHVRSVVRGDTWWCLGMSEPQAGSDLASLRTTAKELDNGFLINGQKVWTSHARDSRHCIVFARTDKLETRHRGITAFVMAMDTPGISVRAIAKIGAGDEEFCEVFLDDVYLPASAMLGPLNGGWKVAMESLSFERDMIWIMNLVEIERALELSEMSLEERPNAALSIELERLKADADSIWLTGLRGLGHRLTERPDAETPILKLFSTEAAQRAFDLAARSTGDAAALVGAGAPFDGEIVMGEIEALGATIYGGTSEIQRNIIGEKLLGLPR